MMIIGLLKEVKTEEYRVALIPRHVKVLVKMGHQTCFEPGCGASAGFTDEHYRQAGGIKTSRRGIFEEADLIVKVKTPQDDEPGMFQQDQVLFSYLHYDGNESLEGAETIRKAGATAIAFEWVEEPDGDYPLLTPMSELTGIIGATKILELYREKRRGIAGDYSNRIPPKKVLLVGLGTIGTNALNVFLHQGLHVTILDKHPETLDKRVTRYVPAGLWARNRANVVVIRSDEANPDKTKEELRKLLPGTDILFFSAVRRPTFTADHLITSDMISLMKENCVLIDAAANDHDLVETIKSHPEIDGAYKIHGVWHYANDHMPTMAASDASIILSTVILPYVVEITNKGLDKSLIDNPALLAGTTIANKQYTHEYTCKKRGLPFLSPWEALELDRSTMPWSRHETSHGNS